MSLLRKILKVFGLCLYRDYEDVCITNNRLEEKEAYYKEQIKNRESTLTKLQESNRDLHRFLDEKNRRNDELISENKQLKQQKFDYEGTQELIKDLQTALYNRIKQHEDWGFYNCHAFPGSLSVNTRDYVKPPEVRTTKLDELHTAITGTIVVPDDITPMINNAKSAREKLGILIKVMKDYKIYDKIMEYMIKIPNFEYALTYNDDCTSYQLYYRLVVEHPDPSVTLDTFDNV